MKVALVAAAGMPAGGVTPRVEQAVGAERARERFHDQPPLSLLLLSARLPGDARRRLHLEARDGPFRPAPDDDLVLCTFPSSAADRAFALADECRAAGVATACGGVHASALPDACAARFDAVCAGEMEALPDGWFAAVARGEARGVFRPGVPAPEALPVPDYDLLPADETAVVPLQSTRGCPVGCEFCAATAVFGARHRPLPDGWFAASLERLARVRPDRAATRILLVDDNFFLDRGHAFATLDRLGRAGYPVTAYADLRIADDPELLRAAARAGVRSLFVGLESARPERIRAASPLKAGLALTLRERVEAIQGAGIGVFASFVVGMDGDDERVFAELRELLREVPLARAAFGFPVPYPGTALAERLAREGRLPHAAWSEHHEWNPLIPHPRLSREELIEGVAGLYDLFYSTELSARRIRHFKRLAARGA